MASPRGPVYLSLPREPLSAPVPDSFETHKPRGVPSRPHPDPQMIATLAGWVASARNPLIIATSSGGEAMAALGRFAERYAIPVVAHRQLVVCLPSSHTMHMGYDPQPFLPQADLIIEIESDVPYMPNVHGSPAAACRVATIGEDPAYVRYPMRSFPADLAITATPASAFAALESALVAANVPNDRIEERRKAIAERKAQRQAALTKASQPDPQRITPAFLSRAIAEAVGKDAVIFNEYSLMQDHCPREEPDTYYGLSSAGGLG
jgi:acetolactate synthase-1/2/3 large subunit